MEPTARETEGGERERVNFFFLFKLKKERGYVVVLLDIVFSRGGQFLRWHVNIGWRSHVAWDLGLHPHGSEWWTCPTHFTCKRVNVSLRSSAPARLNAGNFESELLMSLQDLLSYAKVLA